MKKIFLTLLISLSPLISIHAEVPEILGLIHSDTIQTQFGKEIVHLRDHNNDGFDEILTWGYNKKTFLYQGGCPVDTIADFIFDSVSSCLENVGDINLDAYDDFIVFGYGPYSVKLNLYYGGPTLDTIRDAWFGADTLRGGQHTVLGGDINQNGNNEFICQGAYNQGVVIFFELGSDFDSIPDFKLSPPNETYIVDYDSFGNGLISGDFNGDGLVDIASAYLALGGTSTSGEIWLYWNSPSFDTIPDMKIPRPGGYVDGSNNFGKVLENIGDFNHDGWDDFFVSSELALSDRLGFIFFGGPSIDTIPDIIIDEPGTQASYAGDLNNDGYEDFLTSYPLSFHTAGFVKIFFGGPDADSIPDVVINNYDIEGIQEYFGNDVAGIGDFNGDGIDDFAFSAVNQFSRGEIYIMSGWDDATDVPYEYEPTLPNGFNLYQNYPNPFNNSTTISFEIPYKEVVSLKIYNILGEEVKNLINKELSAGTYNLEWDGTANKGQLVSSGVYLYKLSSSIFTQEMKMVLVK